MRYNPFFPELTVVCCSIAVMKNYICIFKNARYFLDNIYSNKSKFYKYIFLYLIYIKFTKTFFDVFFDTLKKIEYSLNVSQKITQK